MQHNTHTLTHASKLTLQPGTHVQDIVNVHEVRLIIQAAWHKLSQQN